MPVNTKNPQNEEKQIYPLSSIFFPVYYICPLQSRLVYHNLLSSLKSHIEETEPCSKRYFEHFPIHR